LEKLTPGVLDALLTIADATGGERVLLRQQKHAALSPALELLRILGTDENDRGTMEAQHAALHRVLDPALAPCAWSVSGCTSANPAVRGHADAMARINWEITRALRAPVQLHGRKRVHADVPLECRDRGSVFAFFKDRLGFNHRETALLRMFVGKRQLSEEQLGHESAAVRQACSAYRRKLDRSAPRQRRPKS
jgi:hypothetical protein